MSEREERVKGPFILWLDYGLEGWAPTSFETEADLVNALMKGGSSGQAFVITSRLSLRVVEENE